MACPRAPGSRRTAACAALVVMLAVAGCDDREASPEPLPPDPTRLTEVEMVALMEGHYGPAIAAHDALIRSDLATLRARLGELEGRSLPAAAPESWRPFDERFARAARAAASARDLDEAASRMGALVEACGACHEHAARGPVYQRPLPPEGQSVVENAMLLHQWATERLWEGVTGPWDEAWARGASALAESRVFADAGEGAPVASTLLAQEEAMRALGRTALTTSGLHARAEVYGRLLATCGRCHLEAGIAFAPTE